MRAIKTLKILGFVWTIEEGKDVAYQGGCWGATHHGPQKIFLEPDMTKQKREQVIIHEILHAIWWQQGLTERYKDTPKIEEEIITTISQGIYQVFNDNDLLK